MTFSATPLNQYLVESVECDPVLLSRSVIARVVPISKAFSFHLLQRSTGKRIHLQGNFNWQVELNELRQNMKIGFLGAGRMAQALARGLLAAELAKPEDIFASCPKSDEILLKEMQILGCKTTFENTEVVQQSQTILMAVKPHVVRKLLADVTGFVTPQHLIISVAMGISIHHIEKMLPPKSRVIRAMPNTPALIREGASVFCSGASALPEDAAAAHRLFSSVGTCEEVTENLLDAVTGLSGSGPAYMYIAIEALADGAVKMGMPRDLAMRLATQTMLGSAKMVQETSRHPGALKDDVCSPAGTTIEAVYQLEKGRFRATLMAAVQAATHSAKEAGLGE